MQTLTSTTLRETRRINTVVIGGGQTGLATGYYLARRGIPFVILEANARVGDSWRNRWDSLRLFTMAKYDGLPGMRFPAPPHSFPTKDAMANYLEAYAKHFRMPVQTNTRVERLSKSGSRYIVDAGTSRFEADNVVVAMATFQKPKIPGFASGLSSDVRQLHSSEYRNPSQLKPGGVLVVGAGNSGAEIALDIARARSGHEVWLSGRHTGAPPFRVDGVLGRYIFAPIFFNVVFPRILSIDTPVGRKVRPRFISKGAPLIRARLSDLDAVGVQRVSRLTGVESGRPVLEDRSLLGVANVIWSTGFTPGFSWIDLPIFTEDGEVAHRGGFVESAPGLSFVGLHFLYALSSTMIYGAARDAKRIVNAIDASPRSDLGDRRAAPSEFPRVPAAAP